MQHYLEIKILPDPEFGSTMLMSALYNKLHRGLVQFKNLNIGVSFPDYFLDKSQNKSKNSLGDIMRLHGMEEELKTLMDSSWLKGMNDHISLSNIYPIPLKVTYATVRRVQTQSNVERIRRRQMKRHNLTEEEVKLKIPISAEKRLDFPFVMIKSQSSKRDFPLFIQQTQVDVYNTGLFNTYGLSKEAAIPLF